MGVGERSNGERGGARLGGRKVVVVVEEKDVTVLVCSHIFWKFIFSCNKDDGCLVNFVCLKLSRCFRLF